MCTIQTKAPFISITSNKDHVEMGIYSTAHCREHGWLFVIHKSHHRHKQPDIVF